MPTYDYECRQCGHRFELFQSITEEPVKRCPKCGKNTARRLFGGGLGIIFKGSGFYTTDYKRSGAVTGGNGSSRSKAGGDTASSEKSAGEKSGAEGSGEGPSAAKGSKSSSS
jgi:putative FmdB family regulatory protein